MQRFAAQSIRLILAFSFSAVILLFAAPKLFGKASFDEMHRILTKNAAFDSNDLADLKKREAIIKLLPSVDKREVGVLGVVAVEPPLDSVLQNLMDSMARQNKKSIIESGVLSDTPAIDDLKNLTLEAADFEEIKKCLSEKCGFGLSAEMIERFRKEIDLSDPDYKQKANQLFRLLLLEYLQKYLTKGNEALIEYANSKEIVQLRNEQSSLLKNLLWINDLAPEFRDYLEKYPLIELPNIRQTINWTKISFGLKPFIIVTQTITFTVEKEGVSQVLSVSKQLYASRYFDSSLGLTALINFPAEDGLPNSYLIYSNHSRSSTLDGAFSGFKRKIVEREAIEKLKPLLADAKNHRNPPQTSPLESEYEKTLFEGILEQTWLLSIFGIFLGITAAFLFWNRAKRKGTNGN